MDWFSASDYWLTRFVIQRSLGLVYLIAFLVALNQFRPLLGERGLLPMGRYLSTVSFRQAPSIFHLHYSDRFFSVVAWTGVALSAAAMFSITDSGPLLLSMITWLALWALYLSIVNVGQTFYGFGWETLLLEAGSLAVFLGSSDVLPPVLVIWLIRWLLFRVEFGAGLIKMRGDQCWRDLSCLDYHHETQPMPNPLSWYFHHLPRRLHRVEVFGNHVAQLVAPVLLFTPQPVAGIAGAVIVLTQCWLLLSGNFSWLNLLTITLGVSAFSGAWLHHLVPVSPPATLSAPPRWYEAVVITFTVAVAVLSWWPARNMASSRQFMNASFNRLHLVNTYGAFGSVTRVRNEVVIEGTDDLEITPASVWREYEFKGKPTDPRRRPAQIAPYHLRLDWLLWFAALGPTYAHDWFAALMLRLLENDPPTLALLRRNPFGEVPPIYVRARLYRYRFTTREERRETGDWWARTLIGEYTAPVTLAAPQRVPAAAGLERGGSAWQAR